MPNTESARFNARLTKEQKEFFEFASRIGGYRSLTDFVIQSAQERAHEIVEAHHKILASQRDQEIFFEAILHPENPSLALQEALTAYNNALHIKE